MKNSWLEEFQIDELTPKMDIDKSDYDVFEDKELLDKFRNSIIQELIDSEIKSSSLFGKVLRTTSDKYFKFMDSLDVKSDLKIGVDLCNDHMKDIKEFRMKYENMYKLISLNMISFSEQVNNKIKKLV